MPRDRNIADLLAKAQQPVLQAPRLHSLYKGKIQVMPKCAIRGLDDFAIWYTPGVAEPCRAIAKDPDLVFEYTNKGNSIAIVTDGTRVLGLGDIGPQAALPVMEGKSLLFKYLGGVDAIPVCLDTRDTQEIVRTARLLAPAFGGINLEDIAQPKCFRVLDALRADCQIPVWHDDQQGTAAVVLAALINALKVVGKSLQQIRVAMIGAGAANVATYRLLTRAGVAKEAVVACDSKGVLHPGRRDIATYMREYPEKWQLCTESNGDRVVGGLANALRDADACLAFSQSGPGIIEPEWVRAMAKSAIVFACANPVPEIWPWEAKEAGAAIVATGRSDFANQVNNALCFPGIFRGVLDIRARSISDGMAIAAARELAACVEDSTLSAERILPSMDEWQVAARVAAATAAAAQSEGLARLSRSPEEILDGALRRIGGARNATAALMRDGWIAAPLPA
jgi:malate dehydrogenase (oxaloacetate-decarboxylating)